MSHPVIRAMSRQSLKHLVDLFHDEDSQRELDRRARQSHRSLSHRKVEPRGRVARRALGIPPQPNPVHKVFALDTPKGPVHRTLHLGRFVSAQEVEELKVQARIVLRDSKPCVDFDHLPNFTRSNKEA